MSQQDKSTQSIILKSFGVDTIYSVAQVQAVFDRALQLESQLEALKYENENRRLQFEQAKKMYQDEIDKLLSEVDTLKEASLDLAKAVSQAHNELEMFNFAKDEVRVRSADDILFKAIHKWQKSFYEYKQKVGQSEI